jgi:hypothetical protein
LRDEKFLGRLRRSGFGQGKEKEETASGNISGKKKKREQKG